MTTFWLGTDRPEWLSRTDVPLFISRRRLCERKKPASALGSWALDSGGFSELSLHGRWTVSLSQYVEEVQRWSELPGKLAWAASVDWMCEPWILEKTGLSVVEHQRRTVENYLELRRLSPQSPWVPVIQGWAFDDYARHVEDYASAGVDLAELPLVGVGSVCRRQDTSFAAELVEYLAGMGLRIHAFGVKTLGLVRMAPHLASSDSMAWSFTARRQDLKLPECTHKARRCNHCLRWAMKWREKVLRIIGRARQKPVPLTLF